MTTYSVRCRNFSCRHRRVINKHPDEYVRTPPCPKCGKTAGWRVENRDYNKRNLCHCNGPKVQQSKDGGPPAKHTTFPHKTTHPMCDHHPHGPYNQAKAQGVADEDIPLEYLGRKVNDETPPF